MSTKKHSIRFGVRSEVGQCASTWHLTTRTGGGKSDLYLACRKLGRAFKASLHQSGSWHVGFIRDFVRKHIEPGHRLHDDPYIARWQRPPEIAPGTTLAYRVIVPRRSVTIPAGTAPSADIHWIDAAPAGLATEVIIAITSRGTRVTGWPGRTVPGTHFVCQMPMDNGGTVWVLHRVAEVPFLTLPTGSQSWIDGHSAADLNGGSIRAILFGPTGYMVDCAVEVVARRERGHEEP